MPTIVGTRPKASMQIPANTEPIGMPRWRARQGPDNPPQHFRRGLLLHDSLEYRVDGPSDDSGYGGSDEHSDKRRSRREGPETDRGGHHEAGQEGQTAREPLPDDSIEGSAYQLTTPECPNHQTQTFGTAVDLIRVYRSDHVHQRLIQRVPNRRNQHDGQEDGAGANEPQPLGQAGEVTALPGDRGNLSSAART